MSASYLLRPLCTSCLLHSPSSSEDRRVSCIRFNRWRSCLVPPVFALGCRCDGRLGTSLSPKLTGSPSRIKGTALPRNNLTQTMEVDAKVIIPQLVATEALSIQSSALPNSRAVPASIADPVAEWSRQVYAASAESKQEVSPKSEYYEPNDGDLVLGVVTHADEHELSLEIGSRFPALLTMRDFQPFTEVGTNSFFKLPLGNDSNETVEGFVVPPVGKVLLVGDQTAIDGVHPEENVKIGTVLVAEVQSKALGEGRPFLTCRRLAQNLAFLRIEQIMKMGEPIQIEITQHNDGGIQGYLEGVRAFLPRSELLVRPENTAALQDYVGKTLTVAVAKVEEYSSNVIISEVKPWMSENLLLGTVHDLIITKLFPYGIQVEILDTRIRGFIHITNITRGFVTSVYTFFTEGEVIKGMVIKGKKPGQLSFSIEALEPPDEDGLILRNKERVFDGAEEVAKGSEECQLPMEERRLFAMPSAATSVTFQDRIANLPWLQLRKLRKP